MVPRRRHGQHDAHEDHALLAGAPEADLQEVAVRQQAGARRRRTRTDGRLR